MKILRGCIAAIGIIGILVILALVTSYFLFSLTPPIKSKMVPVPVSAEAAEKFDQKIDAWEAEIEDAVANDKEMVITLTITEQEINNKILDILAEGELPIKEALVNLGEGYLLAYVVIDNPGVDAETGTLALIEVEDEELKITVEDFDLGKLPLPQGVQDGVEKLVNILTKLKLTDLPVKTTDVQINNHQLIITGVTKTTE